jgi:hypothetical protein
MEGTKEPEELEESNPSSSDKDTPINVVDDEEVETELHESGKRKAPPREDRVGKMARRGARGEETLKVKDKGKDKDKSGAVEVAAKKGKKGDRGKKGSVDVSSLVLEGGTNYWNDKMGEVWTSLDSFSGRTPVTLLFIDALDAPSLSTIKAGNKSFFSSLELLVVVSPQACFIASHFQEYCFGGSVVLHSGATNLFFFFPKSPHPSMYEAVSALMMDLKCMLNFLTLLIQNSITPDPSDTGGKGSGFNMRASEGAKKGSLFGSQSSMVGSSMGQDCQGKNHFIYLNSQ